MGRNRLVPPETVRLFISDGDYLDVKKQLNAGEYRKVIAGMSAPSHFGEQPVVNLEKVGLTKIVQYLVGWSLCGPNNKPIPYSIDQPVNVREDTILGLDKQTYGEIRDAIDKHEEDQEKNEPRGEIATSAISTSAA